MPPPQPSYINWDIGSEVSQEVATAFKDGAAFTHEYMRRLGFPDVRHAVTIHLYGDPEALAVAYAKKSARPLSETRHRFSRPTVSWSSADRQLAILLSEPASRGEESFFWGLETTARRIVQLHIGEFGLLAYACLDQLPDDGPYWLREGIYSGDFLALRALSPRFSAEYSDRLNLSQPVRDSSISLNEVASASAYFRVLYAPGFGPLANYRLLTVGLLMAHAGDESLPRYLSLLQTGHTWRDAFQNAFGMSIDEFYELFDEQRATGFPSLGMSSWLEDLNSNPQQRLLVPAVRNENRIRNSSGNIQIEYSMAVSSAEANHDLSQTQCNVDFLTSLFGDRPSQRIVFEITNEMGFKWAEFRPSVTVPFQFDDDRLQVHEIGHVFTHYLSPTSESWFDEGISTVAETIYELIQFGQITELSEFELSSTTRSSFIQPSVDAYARLKERRNVFGDNLDRPDEWLLPEWSSPLWINTHNTGILFFLGLEDYGITGGGIHEFLVAIGEIADRGRRIGVNEIKEAAKMVSGTDITPLIDLLEPGIVFNRYVLWTSQEDIDKFFKQNPEYMSPNVSWID